LSDGTPTVRVLRLAHGADLPLPGLASPGSAGLDLRAAIPEPLALQPGERVLVPTGIALELPHGFEGQVRPRSGLALTSGVTLLNSPGTIDSDYRGEIKVLLVHLGGEPCRIDRGDRIAQLVVARVELPRVVEVAALAPSERGEGGFGSSGNQ
jgi:dUTP pyrophosphatase